MSQFLAICSIETNFVHRRTNQEMFRITNKKITFRCINLKPKTDIGHLLSFFYLLCRVKNQLLDPQLMKHVNVKC